MDRLMPAGHESCLSRCYYNIVIRYVQPSKLHEDRSITETFQAWMNEAMDVGDTMIQDLNGFFAMWLEQYASHTNDPLCWTDFL